MEGYQESNSQDQSNFSGDVSDNRSGSGRTASVSDTPLLAGQEHLDSDEVSGSKREKEKTKTQPHTLMSELKAKTRKCWNQIYS